MFSFRADGELPQTITLYVVSLPVQIGMFTGPPIGAAGWLGVVLALTGIALEAIGDAQMSRLKAENVSSWLY